MRNHPAGMAMLLAAALIWGTALVAQSLGMNYAGPFAFNAARFFIGGVSVWLISVLSGQASARKEKRMQEQAGVRYAAPLASAAPKTGGQPGTKLQGERCARRALLKGGFLCGLVLFVTVSLQQIGISKTSVGKAGFITTLYIIMVPLLSVFLGKRVPVRVWLCIALATGGLYLLCVNETLSINMGDVYIFLCALMTAVHLLLIDRYAHFVDCLKLTYLQIFLCSALSAVCALLFEEIRIGALLSGWGPLLYTGFLSCAAAYLFQTLGQKYVNPVGASLLLSLESVFAACAGWLFLHEVLSGKETIGCILIFTATLLAQLPGRKQARV